MVECPSCGRKHRPGSLFCSECGVYLPTGGPLGTEPIPGQDLPAARARAWTAESQGECVGDRDVVLRLRILPTDRNVQVPASQDFEVGRLDSAQGVFPDLDLTPAGGLEGGVSRRHCKIYESEGEYYVEDLGSANGTFVDGERLTPYLPHVLRDGDRLQLGRILLEITIQR